MDNQRRYNKFDSKELLHRIESSLAMPVKKWGKRILISGFVGLALLLGVSVLNANADETSTNRNNIVSFPNQAVQVRPRIKPKRPKKIIKRENLNGTTTSVPKKYIVRNHNYGFYYNMDPIYNKLRTIRGNTKVTFSHPIYLNYAKLTHYKYGRPFGDPQSMAILPDGRTYVLFNAGHSDSPYNRILEYSMKTQKLMKIGQIFHGGHGQGLSYDYRTHRLLLCMNRFIAHHHGLLRGSLLISHVGKRTLKPFGKIDRIKAPKNMNLGDDFTTDAKGNYYNVSKYGNDTPFSPYGGLSIYRGNRSQMKLIKLLFNGPNSTVQNIEYNPETNRIYIVGNACITSFPVNKLNHLKNKYINVSIFNRQIEFESLGFYRGRAYLLLPRPARILVSNRLF